MSRSRAYVSSADGLSIERYPVRLEHRDKPDCALTGPAGGIGIEVVEAIPEQYAAYVALANREYPDAILDASHFRRGSPRKSLAQMRALLKQTHLTGEPWYGDSVEREWADWMLEFIDRKIRKLGSPGFEVFPVNWLAIYDNIPGPNLDLGRAVSLLIPAIVNRWHATPTFDAIFIEHGPVIVELTRQGAVHMVLRDLW